MRPVVYFFSFVVLWAHCPRGFAAATDTLVQGNFTAAVEEYQQLLSKGEESAALYYNLAIAEYRLAAIGKALFHFRRAQQLRPRDADINFNLAYVRSKASDKIEGSNQSWIERFSEYYPLNKKESLYLLTLLVLLASACGTIGLWKPWTYLRWLQRASLLLVFLLGSATLILWQGSSSAFGVVVSSTADIYSGQGAGSVVLFSLHEGAEFTLKDRDRQWLRIALADGKQGWVPEKQVLVSDTATGGAPNGQEGG